LISFRALLRLLLVGDYAIFIDHWAKPEGGIHGYLTRFVASGDPTFQHIAIWTLLQLLESGDKKLVECIAKSDDICDAIKSIAEREVPEETNPSTPTGGAVGGEEEGEGEVVALARRCLECLGN